ncbi:MAG: M48 family peptidase, partial [Hyphomicrobiales bacterium]|nr:M48 family peptidase [Hyphomicrobiales bacterium]
MSIAADIPSEAQNRARPARAAATLVVTLLFLASLVVESIAPAEAQGRFIRRLRDTEIEALLRDYAKPLFGAAGIGSASIGIVLVDDRSFNAFVAD